MRRQLRRLAILGLGLLAATIAHACPLCLSAFQLTISLQDLSSAQRAVLAVPRLGGTGFEVVDVIKGRTGIGEIIPDSVFRADLSADRTRPLLLLREDRWSSWVSFGRIAAVQAEWLRRKVDLPSAPADGDVAGWRSRLMLFLPALDSDDALVADIATAEFARAPYAALRMMKGAVSPEAMRASIDDSAATKQRSLRLLLLGVSGDASDVARIEAQLAAERAAQHSHDVAALLAADLELRGPSRLAWIEKTYLLDRKRSFPEVEAALLALSTQGSANATIPRPLVIATYRRFMRERNDLAGYVAVYLAAWDDWSAAPEYLALLKVNALREPSSRYAAIAYLLRSPNAGDQAAVKALGVAP